MILDLYSSIVQYIKICKSAMYINLELLVDLYEYGFIQQYWKWI